MRDILTILDFIMLIEFSVENYLSFRSKAKFSLNSASIRDFQENNVFETGKYRLLKGAAVYGANASGKSNLIKALHFLRNLVLRSAQNMQISDEIPVQPFKLNSETETQPSAFEVVFFSDGITYRYGIEVDRKSVIAERLAVVKASNEKLLFERRRGEFTIKDAFEEGKGLADKTRDNALFLSVVAQFNGAISRSIFDWFNKTNFILGSEDEPVTRSISKNLLMNKDFHRFMLELIKSADIGLLDIVRNESMTYDGVVLMAGGKVLMGREKNPSLFSLHRKYNGHGIESGEVKFDFDAEESDGTRKLFRYSGPIYTSLYNGERLIIDELDFGLHTMLTRLIVSLFNSKKTNPKNAQLVFTTHDTNLLSADILRRDQIWFTEKDQYGGTDMYSLLEYKIRNDASFEKDYLQGRYGAVPVLNEPHIPFGG